MHLIPLKTINIVSYSTFSKPQSGWTDVSKIFNLCGHDPPMLQMDGQTDRQTTSDSKTALCTVVHCMVKTKSKTGYAEKKKMLHLGICASLCLLHISVVVSSGFDLPITSQGIACVQHFQITLFYVMC